MCPCPSPTDRDIHRLVFPAVGPQHAGVYKSVIANKLGKAACYAHLYVTGEANTLPSLWHHPGARLEVVVVGAPYQLPLHSGGRSWHCPVPVPEPQPQLPQPKGRWSCRALRL